MLIEKQFYFNFPSFILVLSTYRDFTYAYGLVRQIKKKKAGLLQSSQISTK